MNLGVKGLTALRACPSIAVSRFVFVDPTLRELRPRAATRGLVVAVRAKPMMLFFLLSELGLPQSRVCLANSSCGADRVGNGTAH